MRETEEERTRRLMRAMMVESVSYWGSTILEDHIHTVDVEYVRETLMRGLKTPPTKDLIKFNKFIFKFA